MCKGPRGGAAAAGPVTRTNITRINKRKQEHESWSLDRHVKDAISRRMVESYPLLNRPSQTFAQPPSFRRKPESRGAVQRGCARCFDCSIGSAVRHARSADPPRPDRLPDHHLVRGGLLGIHHSEGVAPVVAHRPDQADVRVFLRFRRALCSPERPYAALFCVPALVLGFYAVDHSGKY